MDLEKKINNILNKIQKENKQVNFDSSTARKTIAQTIAKDLENDSSKNQRRQSDAGSLIF